MNKILTCMFLILLSSCTRFPALLQDMHTRYPGAEVSQVNSYTYRAVMPDRVEIVEYIGVWEPYIIEIREGK